MTDYRLMSRERIGRVTASRVPAILGIDPNKSKKSVLAQMVNEYRGGEPDETNEMQQWGNDHEAEAIEAYERSKGLFVSQCGSSQITVVHPVHDWMAATPDGWVGSSGLVEIKCPWWRARYTSIDRRADHFAQVQFQLACTGQDYCDYVLWRPNEPLIVETVYPVAGWLEGVLPKLRAFYERFLEATGGKLTVLEAHEASDCPDRDLCWAAEIHDRYAPRTG